MSWLVDEAPRAVVAVPMLVGIELERRDVDPPRWLYVPSLLLTVGAFALMATLPDHYGRRWAALGLGFGITCLVTLVWVRVTRNPYEEPDPGEDPADR